MALLDGVQEDAKEHDSGDDTDGVSERSVVNGSAVSSLGVEELAKAPLPSRKYVTDTALMKVAGTAVIQ